MKNSIVITIFLTFLMKMFFEWKELVKNQRKLLFKKEAIEHNNPLWEWQISVFFYFDCFCYLWVASPLLHWKEMKCVVCDLLFFMLRSLLLLMSLRSSSISLSSSSSCSVVDTGLRRFSMIGAGSLPRRRSFRLVLQSGTLTTTHTYIHTCVCVCVCISALTQLHYYHGKIPWP